MLKKLLKGYAFRLVLIALLCIVFITGVIALIAVINVWNSHHVHPVLSAAMIGLIVSTVLAIIGSLIAASTHYRW